MNIKNSVNAGNDHLEALISYTRQMVAANRIPSEKAPAFLGALSDAMMETVARFENVADTVAASGVESSEAPVSITARRRTAKARAASADGKPVERSTKHPRTEKLREALRANADVDPESVPLPAIVQASRYVAPKRSVGRPPKNAAPVVLTPEQQAFDSAFLRKYPVLEGLTVENSIGPTLMTVLFDGKKLKMIKRHLETQYGINFDDYKRIYSLPSDYPSVAPGYAGERRKHALRQGLGTTKVSKSSKAKASLVAFDSAAELPSERESTVAA